jgi:hypothetical protein
LFPCSFSCSFACFFACSCRRRTTTPLRVGAERNAGRPCVQHTVLGCNALTYNVRLQRCNRALASPRTRATVRQLPHATDAAGRPAACDALRAAAADGCADGCRNQSRNVLHPPITRAHPAPSALRLGSPLPHLRRDWAHPAHICAATGLTPPTSAPEPASPLPHLQPDSARTPNARARAHARACASPRGVGPQDLEEGAVLDRARGRGAVSQVCPRRCSLRVFSAWGHEPCGLKGTNNAG